MWVREDGSLWERLTRKCNYINSHVNYRTFTCSKVAFNLVSRVSHHPSPLSLHGVGRWETLGTTGCIHHKQSPSWSVFTWTYCVNSRDSVDLRQGHQAFLLFYLTIITSHYNNPCGYTVLQNNYTLLITILQPAVLYHFFFLFEAENFPNMFWHLHGTTQSWENK